MRSFSQRYGYTPLEDAFQREAIDKRLRTKLWNILKLVIWDHCDPSAYDYNIKEMSKKIDLLVQRLWFHFLNLDMDSLPNFRSAYGESGAYDILKHFSLKQSGSRSTIFLKQFLAIRASFFPIKIGNG